MSRFHTILLLAAVQTAQARCPCGYSAISTNNSDSRTYSHALETDFLHLGSLFPDNPCWRPQVYNQSATQARGSYGKEAALANVVPNPYINADTWTGQGVHGGDAGLQIWVRSQAVDGLVPMGEINSRMNDMQYGSFRIGMRMPAVPGTCVGFFWYHNDSQEIDMEYLSSAAINATNTPVWLVMQTPESVTAGYNAAGTPTYDMALLPFEAENGFHEYRFDWTQGGVSFWTDDILLKTLDYDYPHSGGYLAINHWSNGNAYWSRGPPKEDAVVTVSYIRAYYNRTGDETLHDCNAVVSEAICAIPDAPKAGSRSFPGSLSEADGFFYNRGTCGEVVQGNTLATTGTSTASLASTTPNGGWSRSHARYTRVLWLLGGYWTGTQLL